MALALQCVYRFLALVKLNFASSQSPNSKTIGDAGPQLHEVVMRNDVVQAEVVVVDRLVTASTVAIEGTVDSDRTHR
jgi:hypothetical protein